MNVSELIDAANLQIDDSYDTAQYYVWFQEMLDDISGKLFIPKKVVIAKDGVTGGFTLPVGFKSVLTVQADGKALGRVGIGAISAYGYYLMGGVLYVTGYTPTTVTLFYDATPDRLVSSPDYVPNIPLEYHPMFVLYACKQAMLLEDEVSYEDRYRSYLIEYEKAKQKLETESNRERSNATLASAARWVVER